MGKNVSILPGKVSVKVPGEISGYTLEDYLEICFKEFLENSSKDFFFEE